MPASAALVRRLTPPRMRIGMRSVPILGGTQVRREAESVAG
ncbi:hypothetical protein [Aquipuribacter nitratireducens]|uniref:Uncharacterized protein n=1 Tax=Aquipuribacter nitratireducens TaxID=650104 RepID=A0ABW0GKT9_9MICO